MTNLEKQNEVLAEAVSAITNLIKTLREMRFYTETDTVIDRQTGLEWQIKSPGRMTWDQAMDYAGSLRDNWRLPSQFELSSLLNKEKRNPASDFPEMPSSTFWSSSIYKDTRFAKCIDFTSGYTCDVTKRCSLHVLCVRDAKG